MSVSYQSLLGLTNILANYLSVDTLAVNTIILKTLVSSSLIGTNANQEIVPVTVSSNLNYNPATTTLDTVQNIQTTSSPQFVNVNCTSLSTNQLIYANGSKLLTSVTLANNLTFAGGILNTIQGIRTIDSPQFNQITLTQINPTATTLFINSNKVGLANNNTYQSDTNTQNLQIGLVGTTNAGWCQALSNVYVRCREIGTVNQYRISTNLSTTGVQDNVVYPSWNLYMGNDTYKITRCPPGSNVETTMFQISNTGTITINTALNKVLGTNNSGVLFGIGLGSNLTYVSQVLDIITNPIFNQVTVNQINSPGSSIVLNTTSVQMNTQANAQLDTLTQNLIMGNIGGGSPVNFGWAQAMSSTFIRLREIALTSQLRLSTNLGTDSPITHTPFQDDSTLPSWCMYMGNDCWKLTRCPSNSIFETTYFNVNSVGTITLITPTSKILYTDISGNILGVTAGSGISFDSITGTLSATTTFQPTLTIKKLGLTDPSIHFQDALGADKNVITCISGTGALTTSNNTLDDGTGQIICTGLTNSGLTASTLISCDGSKKLSSVTIGNSIAWGANTIDTVQDIRSSSTIVFNGLVLTTMNSDLTPLVANTYKLGTSTNYWNGIWGSYLGINDTVTANNFKFQAPGSGFSSTWNATLPATTPPSQGVLSSSSAGVLSFDTPHIIQSIDGIGTSTTSSTYTSFAAMDITIIPKRTTSYILLNFSSICHNPTVGNRLDITIQRTINGGALVNLGAGSRNAFLTITNNDVIPAPISAFIDQPTTTGTIVYSIYYRNSDNTNAVYIGKSASGTNVKNVFLAQEIFT